MDKIEIINFFAQCVRNAESMEEYLSESDNYDPDDLREAAKERECYLAAIKALEAMG
jgi:hypothetical protein